MSVFLLRQTRLYRSSNVAYSYQQRKGEPTVDRNAAHLLALVHQGRMPIKLRVGILLILVRWRVAIQNDIHINLYP
jgi:hypothetical protein